MDPDLARLTALSGTDDLTVSEAAHILARSEDTIQRAVNAGKLEAKRHSGRGRGVSPRISISRAALVAYLVRITTGDRAILLAAIEAQCPQYLAAAKTALRPSAESAPSADADLPANAIPFPRPRRHGQRDHLSDHPTLFELPA